MKKILLLLFILVVAAGGFLYLGPRMAVDSINEAIVNEDSEKLSEHIDFQLLRENIKKQFEAAMAKNGEEKNNVFSNMFANIASSAVDKIIDSIITPDGIAAIMDGNSRFGSKRSKDDNIFQDARYSYNSYDSVTVWVKNDDRKEVGMMLQLMGLSWKVVDIKIPDEMRG